MYMYLRNGEQVVVVGESRTGKYDIMWKRRYNRCCQIDRGRQICLENGCYIQINKIRGKSEGNV